MSSYFVKLNYFQKALGSKDQFVVQKSLEWLSANHFVESEFERELFEILLEKIVFGATLEVGDLAAWMFNEQQGYELEEKDLWTVFVQSHLNTAMLGILAQNSNGAEYCSVEIDEGKDYSAAYHRYIKASISSEKSSGMEVLWNYVFGVRSLAGEIVERTPDFDKKILWKSGSQLGSHTYLYNSEITVLFNALPTATEQVNTTQWRNRYVKADKQEQHRIVTESNQIYFAQRARSAFEYAVESGLDWFLVKNR